MKHRMRAIIKHGLGKRLCTAVITAVFALCAAVPYMSYTQPVLAAETYTILDYFGCSITPKEQLSKHVHDHYYLTTEYTRYNGNDYYCSTPNGWDGTGGHMNCTGFAMAVIRDCGGRFPFSGYCLGTNVSRHLINAGVKPYIFNSCYEARKSGVLERGDMLWYRPISAGDCHWAVYWHGKTHWASEGAGNHFSKMHAYAKVYRVYVYKAQHKRGYLRIKVQPSEKKALSSGGYSRKGITFRVYKPDKKTRVGFLKTNAKGRTKKLRLKVGTYYFKQTYTGKTGFKRDTRWHKVIIENEETTTYTIQNKPYTGKLQLQLGIETPDGNRVSLSGYRFAIKNIKNGKTYMATSNAKGVVKFHQVLAGTYQVTQKLTKEQQAKGISVKTKPYRVKIKAKKKLKKQYKNIYKPPEKPPDSPPDNGDAETP